MAQIRKPNHFGPFDMRYGFKPLFLASVLALSPLSPVGAAPADPGDPRTFTGTHADHDGKDLYDDVKRKRSDKRDDDASGSDARTQRNTDHKADRDDRFDFDNPPEGSRRISDSERFNGSEFQPSSFIDSPFGKPFFRDLIDAGQRIHARKDLRLQLDPLQGKDLRKLQVPSILTDLTDYVGAGLPWDLRLRPVQPQLGDWVPSPVDPLANGGFGLSGDNGSPVPYRLNGHVDLDKTAYPWDADN
ncbi:MAG TPA: hypothetical protein V6D17_07255 [Candidatus Obscuribacterales bacterium]